LKALSPVYLYHPKSSVNFLRIVSVVWVCVWRCWQTEKYRGKVENPRPLLTPRASVAYKKGETYPTSHLIENTPTANSEDWPCSAVWRDGSVVDGKVGIGWCLVCG